MEQCGNVFYQVKNSFHILIILFISFFLEPPKFIDCLRAPGTILKVSQGRSLKSTCIYIGYPTPTLRCVLLDIKDQVLITTTPKTVTANYTTFNPMVFNHVKRDTKKVKCTLGHKETGTIMRERTVSVLTECKFYKYL